MGPPAARLLDRLDEFAALMPLARMALLTDLDGTISPIAPGPNLAAVLPDCRGALEQLSGLLPVVACLSGRSAAEAAALVRVPSIVYVGNHGLERWTSGRSERDHRAEASGPALTQVAKMVRPALEEGEMLEIKGLSLTVHYRSHPHPSSARIRLLSVVEQAVRGLALRVREGRMIIEVLPDVAADKGTAARRLLLEASPGGAAYFGDDRTDLDAFFAVHQWGRETGCPALCIAVDSTEAPASLLAEADYLAAGPDEVCRSLRWIAERVALRGGGAGA